MCDTWENCRCQQRPQATDLLLQSKSHWYGCCEPNSSSVPSTYIQLQDFQYLQAQSLTGKHPCANSNNANKTARWCSTCYKTKDYLIICCTKFTTARTEAPIYTNHRPKHNTYMTKLFYYYSAVLSQEKHKTTSSDSAAATSLICDLIFSGRRFTTPT